MKTLSFLLLLWLCALSVQAQNAVKNSGEQATSMEDLLQEEDIWMMPQVRDIAEVVVNAPRYLQLRGYFRAYQMAGGKMEFFNEGYQDFIFDLKSKGKFKPMMLDNRRYVNASLLQGDELAQSRMGLLIDASHLMMGRTKVPDAVRQLVKDETAQHIEKRNPETGNLYAALITDTVRHTQRAFIDGLMNRTDTTYSNRALNLLARLIGIKDFRFMKIKYAEVYDSDGLQVSRAEMASMHDHYKASYRIKDADSTRVVDVYLDFYVTERNQLGKEEYKKLPEFGISNSEKSKLCCLFYSVSTQCFRLVVKEAIRAQCRNEIHDEVLQ